MEEHISHHCGLCVTHTLHDAYSFIKTLQHRGRDAVGIAGIGRDRIDALKWIGTVETVDLLDLHKIMPSSGYHTFLAHVRYATKGSKRRLLEDAHPHVLGGTMADNGSHVIYTKCDAVAVHNGHVEDRFLNGAGGGDHEVGGCDTARLLRRYWDTGEDELMRAVPGAFTMAIADRRRDEVLVLRDRTGIRPGVLGIKDGKHVAVSEDIALRKNGGDSLEDLDPARCTTSTPPAATASGRWCRRGWRTASSSGTTSPTATRSWRDCTSRRCAARSARCWPRNWPWIASTS